MLLRLSRVIFFKEICGLSSSLDTSLNANVNIAVRFMRTKSNSNARNIFSAFGNNLRMRGSTCNLIEILFEDCARI